VLQRRSTAGVAKLGIYCTILISSARGVTSDHMDEISISATQVGTWDTPKISATIFWLQSNIGKLREARGYNRLTRCGWAKTNEGDGDGDGDSAELGRGKRRKLAKRLYANKFW